MLSVGDILPLTIEKPAAGGRMIARAEGLVVLVSGAIPSERVQALIERVGKGVAYAVVVDIDEPSPDRRTTAADPLCGGCLYTHIAYPRQVEIKSLVIADAFARIGRLKLPAPVPVAPSPEEGYRMRARLHVRGRLLGFFREGTHEVCDARLTRQLLPATSDALDRLVAAMHSLGIDGVREIEVAENIDASRRVVHLDRATPIEPRSLDLLAATDGLTGLSSAHGTRGEVQVTDTIAIDGHPPASLRRHVLAFFQGNRYLLNQLAGHVVEQVPPGSEVIDLYAGVGLFAVAAAAIRRARVTAVEGDRTAAADLAANAAATPSGSVVAVRQSVEEFVRSVRLQADRSERSPERSPERSVRLPASALGYGEARRSAKREGWQPDRDRRDRDLPDEPERTVIVDPPRTGMSREALDGMIRLGASRIVYVSCDVATLARDARRLIDSGYTIARADGFDLFPNTPHVETVVVFQRI